MRQPLVATSQSGFESVLEDSPSRGNGKTPRDTPQIVSNCNFLSTIVAAMAVLTINGVSTSCDARIH